MTDTTFPSPDDPMPDQRALHERWCALMGELGFSRRALWLASVDVDRRMVPPLVKIEDYPGFPIRRMCASSWRAAAPSSTTGHQTGRWPCC